jgi:alkylation response protein AidB-like acyl-CoA dehydrogenase
MDGVDDTNGSRANDDADSATGDAASAARPAPIAAGGSGRQDPPPSFPGVAARAAEVDSLGHIPAENWKEVAASGYLRLFHPPEAGGTGADALTQAVAMEELARACPSTYWSVSVSGLLCAKVISMYGDPVEHRRLLDPLLAGEISAAFAIVERAAGSDAGTYRTSVRRAPGADGGFVIRGEKARVTNAPTADVAVVLARREKEHDGDDGPQWCLAFVDLRQPRVSRYDIPRMGLRGMPWGGMVFDDAHVAAADVVPVPFDALSEGMSWGWLKTSFAAVGVAGAALDAAVGHARERVSFGRPLAHMEGVQAQLADSQVQLVAARTLARHALAERVAGRPARELIAMLKVYATEMAVEVATRAVQIHGAFGVTSGHPVERLYRDAQMNVIGSFTTNRLREQVAENLGVGAPTYAPFDWLSPAGLTAPLPGLDGFRRPWKSPAPN